MAGENAGSQVALVTGGYDHTIKLWQAHSGVCLRTMQHPDSVRFTKYVTLVLKSPKTGRRVFIITR